MLAMSARAALIEPDLELEARRLLAAASEAGVLMRLIGGMAIRLLAGSNMNPALERPIQDLDFVVARRQGRAVEQLLELSGYVGNREFNALHGQRRLLFRDELNERQVDAFIGEFRMCHELPLAERLELLPLTLPAAELLMSKLQIVHLNSKDRADALRLLLSHEVALDRDEGAINVARIVDLTSQDWGLQHTFELNLARLVEALPALPLSDAERAAAGERIEELIEAMSSAPKSRRWKLRARIGERAQWYDEPEEVERGT
jgi:hypothetical protein